MKKFSGGLNLHIKPQNDTDKLLSIIDKINKSIIILSERIDLINERLNNLEFKETLIRKKE